jgi:hypothetical protein
MSNRRKLDLVFEATVQINWTWIWNIICVRPELYLITVYKEIDD